MAKGDMKSEAPKLVSNNYRNNYSDIFKTHDELVEDYRDHTKKFNKETDEVKDK